MPYNSRFIKKCIELQKILKTEGWDRSIYPKFIHYLKSLFTGDDLSKVKVYIKVIDIIADIPEAYELIVGGDYSLLEKAVTHFPELKGKSRYSQIKIIKEYYKKLIDQDSIVSK